MVEDIPRTRKETGLLCCQMEDRRIMQQSGDCRSTSLEIFERVRNPSKSRPKLSPLRVAGQKVLLDFTSKALRAHARHSAIPQVMSKRFDRTPEQLALSEQRKAKKAKLLTTAAPTTVGETKGSILARKWIQLPILSDIEMGPRVKVMTWNVSTIRSSLNMISNCASTATCAMSCS